MYLNKHVVSIVSSSSGADTEYTDTPVSGVVYSVSYTVSTAKISSTGTIEITGEESGRSILSMALSTGSWEYSPSISAIDSTGGAVTNSHVAVPVKNERIKLVLAGGGDTKSGTFTIYTQGGA